VFRVERRDQLLLHGDRHKRLVEDVHFGAPGKGMRHNHQVRLPAQFQHIGRSLLHGGDQPPRGGKVGCQPAAGGLPDAGEIPADIHVGTNGVEGKIVGLHHLRHERMAAHHNPVPGALQPHCQRQVGKQV